MFEEQTTKIFPCSQCPKLFATRSNLKRHMENPNIHNIPYIRCRDQKRWKGHSKKIISREETTESNNDRMRKWRSENREKNRQNDLRCRVYRLARQRFGEEDSTEKQNFVRQEIAKRLDRRLTINTSRDLNELPFYSGLQQKIELPSLYQSVDRAWLPELSPTLERRSSTSSSSSSVCSSNTKESIINEQTLPSMHTIMSIKKKKEVIKYVESNKILDEFVGVVLNYVDNS